MDAAFLRLAPCFVIFILSITMCPRLYTLVAQYAVLDPQYGVIVTIRRISYRIQYGVQREARDLELLNFDALSPSTYNI